MITRPASSTNLSGMRSRPVWRMLAFVLLLVQLGLVAHRIEHYLIPDQMECGEDACTAFAPGAGAADGPVLVAGLILVVYALRFWTVLPSFPAELRRRLGFVAQAPPV